MTENETPEEISDTALAALLAKKRQTRIDRCAQGIQAVLDAENCVIDVSVLLTENKITPIIKIISRD